jgi:hypothetical protein
MLYILTVIHLVDYGSFNPDWVEPIHAYDSLEECWLYAESEAGKYEHEEAIVVCLAEQDNA